MPGALFTMARLLNDIPAAEWITGYQCVVDEQGCAVALAPPRAWSAEGFALDPKWIQQESTFWRRSLWEKAGAHLRTNLHFAGDYELWNRFFRHAPLYSADVLIGGFRARSSGQASLDHMPAYEAEMAAVQQETPWPTVVASRIHAIRRRESIISRLKGIGKDALRQRLIAPLMPTPPRIWFHQKDQKFYT
jgi:hypothetical protein